MGLAVQFRQQNPFNVYVGSRGFGSFAFWVESLWLPGCPHEFSRISGKAIPHDAKYLHYSTSAWMENILSYRGGGCLLAGSHEVTTFYNHVFVQAGEGLLQGPAK